MKMVKSLLLGTAAGLVAVTAGQAAELPVKARPVQYVRICSLYGAGFYYMPGTDMCLKIGGWVRSEVTDEANGSLGAGPFNANLNDRSTSNLTVRARGYITADAREQTAYGVARAYIAVGLNDDISGDNPSPNATYANRAFLQWAGFTTGLAVSAFDAIPWAAYNYRAGYLPNENTGDTGWWVWQYTAQFGGGFSATIGAEDRRVRQIIDNTGPDIFGTGRLTTGGVGLDGAGYGGWQVPDIVGNIRIDQAWGYAQVMAAAHEVNPLYYGGLDDKAAGHPSDSWGWAAGVGIKINTPFISTGDNLVAEFTYTEGALSYIDHTPIVNRDNVQGFTQGYGVLTDCVYGGAIATGNASNCEQTTGWVAEAAYEHYWTPQWHQSITGDYMNVSYDSAANAMLCSSESFGAGAGTTAVAAAGCNNNWSYWGVGSRLQWDVTKSFYLGVEVLYTKLISAKSSTGFTNAEVGLGDPSLCDEGACTVSNEDNWAFTLRMHKDFLP